MLGGLRLAVDTGGTFTDVLVADPLRGLSLHKVPTTPADPTAGVVDGLRAAAAAVGQPLREFLGAAELLVHGTTHAINAIVTGRTARTALLTTAGHPDILVFREGGRIEPFNFSVPYPEPFVPKALTFEVPGRILADGTVSTELDEAEVERIVRGFERRNVEAVAVCLLWSVVNPAHELAVGRLIERLRPDLPYTLSHQVNPSLREFRRASSTCLDASLKPIMRSYMGGLSSRLREAGFAGRVLIVTSQGGVMDAAHVAEAPVHLINSGPSMAPVAARAYGCGEGSPILIVGDTGGTTFDVSIVRDGRIPRTRETWLGQPFRSIMTGMPSVDVKSVGAGGGSIASVDEGGLLQVGPESAGAVPGPVCYGRGGRAPTVTDAAVTLGIIDERFFLGGRMRLDRAGAVEAILRDVGRPLGFSAEQAAAAIIELATEHMIQAILDMTVNQGVDPAGATFVAGGGAAGLNCVAIARRLGCRRVMVPETGAALSAAGAMVSDLSAQFQSVLHAWSDRFTAADVNGRLETLAQACARFAEGPGAGAVSTTVHWAVEARYPDQAWEIEVPLRRDRFASRQDVDDLVADFHRVHEQTFAISDPASPVEMVSWNAEVRCRIHGAEPDRLAALTDAHGLPSRRVFFIAEGWRDTPVHRFEALAEGAAIEGPAIVESAFTSVVLDPGARAHRDSLGSLLIEV